MADIAKMYRVDLMDRVELSGVLDVELRLPSGQWIELQYRKSDGEVSLSCGGRLVIKPVASNVVRVEVLP